MSTNDGVLIRSRIDESVVLLTLNRPTARNALSSELRHALSDALDELSSDQTCRAVVITGSDGVFCAGFDLKELAHSESPEELFAEAAAYHRSVHEFPKPLVAAISGHAVAGGLDLALMCDIRIADATAQLGQPQVKMGVPAAFDLVSSVVSEPVARELCLTGRVVDASEARRIGLVNQVADDCVDEALKLASSIAESPGGDALKRDIISSQPNLFTV